MGLFSSVLSEVLDGEAGSMVENVISEHGGVNGLVQQLQQGGLGEALQSWIGGANLPVSAAQIKQALDPDALAKLADSHGLSVDGLCQQLAAHLPKALSHLSTTDDGTPADGSADSSDASDSADGDDNS